MTKQAACNEFDCFFNPKSLAVIGASPKSGKIGREIFNNLLMSKVRVFPANPSHSEVQERLRRKFPPHYSFNNTIDLTGDACAEDYEEVLKRVVPDTKFYDVAVIIALYQTPRMDTRAADVIALVNSESKVPIVACSVGREYTMQIAKRLEERGVPVYPTPERAVKAAWALAHYGTFRRRVMKVMQM